MANILDSTKKYYENSVFNEAFVKLIGEGTGTSEYLKDNKKSTVDNTVYIKCYENDILNTAFCKSITESSADSDLILDTDKRWFDKRTFNKSYANSINTANTPAPDPDTGQTE